MWGAPGAASVGRKTNEIHSKIKFGSNAAKWIVYNYCTYLIFLIVHKHTSWVEKFNYHCKKSIKLKLEALTLC